VNILIVDDEPGTRLLVVAAVERLGHRVLQAADGEEGWGAFKLFRPQVVIADWSMPGMTGTELAARIRAEETGYTYVLVLSGRADEAASREAVQAGADGVLAKPPDPAELERGLITAERITTLHGRLRAGSRVDAETGAGSRSRLDEDLAAMCARVARYGHAFCVALIGVPGAAGAGAAVAAGQALMREIRSGDTAYRLDPEAFVELLPEQGLDTANLAGARLRAAVQSAVGPDVPVSVGLVSTAGAEARPEALLELARAALERSVATGAVQDASAAEVERVRVLIADDDPVSRLTLGALVRHEVGFELVGEAQDAAQAVELALRRRPDVVLLDVNMPGGGGARAAVQIREGLPGVKVLALSADDSQSSQLDMMRAGAVGFVTKGSPDEEILRIIKSSARW
jgi:CheY-like chemotaxis protein